MTGAELARYIAVRLLQFVGMLLVVSIIIFFALRLGPFDPTDQLEETGADPARIAEIRKYWGLDQPLVVQYVRYVVRLAHGDLGRSLHDNRPVSEAIGERLPSTIELTFAAMLVGTLIGLGLGILAAIRRDSWMDGIGRSVGLAGVSLPTFWLGLMLISLFAVRLEWLPAGGRMESGLDFDGITGFYLLDGPLRGRPDVAWLAVKHLALPAFVLGLFVAGQVMRVTRAGMLEALSQDFVKTAMAKGASPARVSIRHALPNALLPIVTILGLQFGLLLSGAAIVETVFAFPGMGKLLIDAISVRDFTQIQASILVLAAIYGLVNLIVDLMYVALDPRVRLG